MRNAKWPFTFYMSVALATMAFASGLAGATPVVVEGPSIADGRKVNVSSEANKGIVVVFLSASCPCSISHMAEVKKLAEENPEFHFVGVHSNTDEDLTFARAYFKSQNMSWPVIQDQDAGIADRFKALKTPHAFVYGKDGQLQFEGGVSDSHEFSRADHKYLREALSDLKAGHAVRMAKVRTLGCTISRLGHAG